MHSQREIEKFLAEAKEADEKAAAATSAAVRDIWLRVASGYRDIARANGHKDQPS
jgi:hypothetical protein